MKKIGRFILLSFSFLFMFVISTSFKTEAKTTVLYENPQAPAGCTNKDLQYENPNASLWDIMCSPYDVLEEANNSSKHRFDLDGYNFTFDYDYKIKFTDADIRDGNVRVNEFYGISENTTITYMDIELGTNYTIPEKFQLFRYNYLNGEFVLEREYEYNSEGYHTIDAPGIYKLKTRTNPDGTERQYYLVYETDFYYSSLRNISYDSVAKQLVYTAEVKTPMNFYCNNTTIIVDGSELENVSCEVLYGEEYGEYTVVLIGSVTTYYYNPNSQKTDIAFNGERFSVSILYDSCDPLVDSEIIYYPSDMVADEFSITYASTGITLPEETVVKFNYSDPNIDQITVNGEVCEIKDNTVTCYLSNDFGNTLEYVLIDTYGNQTTVIHDGIYFSADAHLSAEELKPYIEITENKIEFTNLEEYSLFEKICLIYGSEDLTFICSIINETLKVSSDKYYTGPIIVILADADNNITKVGYESVVLNNGYVESDFSFSSFGDTVIQKDITPEIQSLINLACAGDLDCLETVKVYGQYGDRRHLLSDTYEFTSITLPTYLEMLNTGFTTSNCAFNRCDKEIQVYVEYEIGGVKQSLMAKGLYHDKLPQISITIPNYQPTRTYDFSELDITNHITKAELFANPVDIYLSDDYGNTFEGVINSRFIRYTNRNGVVQELDNKPYSYIANNKNFGYYLLECYVTLANDAGFGKSFFIVVELADTKAPKLQLIGDETMKIKQYDVFKDPEFKCNDESSCTTSIKYYYQTEENEVEKIDTNVHGTYIIKYSAVDGDGNVSVLTRTVIVESVNAMNLTSIIIIIAVVLVLVGSIVLAIIYERKKNKEEEY